MTLLISKKEEEILRRKEIDSLVQLICILSEDVKMKFGMEKCVFFVLKRGKKVYSLGIQ